MRTICIITAPLEKIAKAYLNSRECSFQEAVYHILPELELKINFPTLYFVNTNLPNERIQILLSEKKDSVSYQVIAQIFLRNQILIIMWKNQLQHSAMESALF